MAVPPLTRSSPVSVSKINIRAERIARQGVWMDAIPVSQHSVPLTTDIDTSSTSPPSLGKPTDASITEVRITSSAKQTTKAHVGGIVGLIVVVLWLVLLAYCVWRPRKKHTLNGGSGSNTDHVRSGDSDPDMEEDGVQLVKQTNTSVLEIEGIGTGTYGITGSDDHNSPSLSSAGLTDTATGLNSSVLRGENPHFTSRDGLIRVARSGHTSP
ncbi:hypothetical protein V5O48_011755, partial [Marasmius crinis-equi]